MGAQFELWDEDEKRIEQEENLARVRSRIAVSVVRFLLRHQIFHAEDLHAAVERDTGRAAPASADRVLRDLRARHVIDYRVINRKQSLYEVLYTPRAEGASDMYSSEAGLSDLPLRMGRLELDPVSRQPIPWFAVRAGKPPEFRGRDPLKLRQAVRERLCWVCGQRLGAVMTFVLAPASAITKVAFEPPCHRECARWSVMHCPYFAAQIAGQLAVFLLWATRSFEVFLIDTPDEKAKPWIQVGPLTDITDVEWYTAGRAATRAEAMRAVELARPTVEAPIQLQGPAAMEALERRLEIFRMLLPKE